MNLLASLIQLADSPLVRRLPKGERPLPLPRAGIDYVYALVASDEPLQVRYVGKTRAPRTRIVDHASHDKTSAARAWADSVAERGAVVCMRILGEYPSANSAQAEDTWIAFWSQYCELLNIDLSKRKSTGA